MTQQFLRTVNLIVSKGGKGLDLSELKIEFAVFAPDAQARMPPTATIRVYNLRRDTASKIEKEFDHVSLQAGYGEPGVIFDGTIVQVKKGALNSTDSFVDIFASDLDEFYNFAMVSKTLAAGSTPRDQLNAIIDASSASGVKVGSVPSELGTGGTLPRGKVLFGMSKDRVSDVAKSTNTSWFVQNGQLNVIKDTGYLPGEVVVLNSATGMIGVPETTNAGVEVKCLLNPRIKVGTRIKINEADVTKLTVKQQGVFPNYGAITYVANTAADGIYRVLVIEHFGGNRQNEFESHITCLAVDASAQPASSVKSSG